MGGFTPLSCVLPLPHNPRSKSLNLDSLQRAFVVWVYNKIIFEGKGTKVDSSRLFPVAPPIGDSRTSHHMLRPGPIPLSLALEGLRSRRVFGPRHAIGMRMLGEHIDTHIGII